MQHIKKIMPLILLIFFLSMASVYADQLAFFSLNWNNQTNSSIPPNALDCVGQTVYYGEGNTFGYTNYLYAVNITNGNQIWRYNASLPVNYVSHFNYNGNICVVAGTGGSTTPGLVSRSFVIARTPNNITLWQSANLNSSVRSLGSATNHTGNGDDVVAGLLNGTLLRISGTNGSILWRYNCIGEVFTISELKNGSVFAGSIEGYNAGHVYCFEKNGTLRWEFPQSNRIILVKKFADVNNDGEPDIIAVFTDGLIHVLNGLNGQEVTPTWPFNNNGDYVKNLLCSQDYTGDGFPDIVFGTDSGNLTIINGLTAQYVKSANTGYVISSLQYMYFFKDGAWYSNKTLAASLSNYLSYYVFGINASDLTLMKQFQTPNNAQARNLFNIGNYTSSYTGDLIFTANDYVYNISGTDIIVPEFPSQIALVTLIAVLFLLTISRRKRLQIE